MSLIVEDGTGLPDSNAYASIAEVDAILATNIYSTWASKDDATKGALIQWATRVLDERVRWNGKKFAPTSSLAWPRIKVKDREGILIDDNLVPKPVKVAVALLCNHFINVGTDPETANGNANLTFMRVDSIEVKYDPRFAPERYPPEIAFTLEGLGFCAFGRGSKRIVKV